MGCNNHPTPKDIAEIQNKSNEEQRKVRDAMALPAPGAAKEAADHAAKEVAKFSLKQIEKFKESLRSGGHLTKEDIVAAKQEAKREIERFAKQKQEEISWKSRNEVVMVVNKKTGELEAKRDSMPLRNAYSESTIPGFHARVNKEYDRSGNPNFNILLRDEYEPNKSTHIHHHKDGITLSTYSYIGEDPNTGRKIATIDRFDFARYGDFPDLDAE